MMIHELAEVIDGALLALVRGPLIVALGGLGALTMDALRALDFSGSCDGICELILKNHDLI